MKVYKYISNACIIASAAVFGLSLALARAFATSSSEAATSIVTAAFTILFLFVGTLLYFVPNRICKALGIGFTLTNVAVQLGYALNDVISYPYSFGTGSILAIVGAALYAIAFVFFGIHSIVAHALEITVPDQDPKIQAVLKWKGLLDQGIISAEEFEAKRRSILGIDKKEPAKK